MPSWGWQRINDHEYRFYDRWAVRKDWARPVWNVERDGGALLEEYPTAAEAMEAADRMRKAEE